MIQLSKKTALLLVLLIGILISSCTKTKETPETGKYASGVLISNEGNFTAGNGSISYYDSEKDSVTNEIFRLENNRSLGDVVQSVSRIGDYAFIQVNNSNKIEIVDKNSFAEMGVIQNLFQVRYAIGGENTAYASAWGDKGTDGKVYFIDVNTLKVSDSVSTGLGPEAMILADGKLFVANSGGLGYDSTVSVIDPINKQLIQNIFVGPYPKSMVVDKNNYLWVLCSGSDIYDANWTLIGHRPSKLVQINPSTNAILKEIDLFTNQYPTKLAINPEGDQLYFGGGYSCPGIYTLPIEDDVFAGNALITKTFYGFDINPADGVIFAYDAMNYSERGILYRYDKNGIELGNYRTGIIPNGSSFKRN